MNILFQILIIGIIFILLVFAIILIVKYKNLNDKKDNLLASVTHDLKTPAIAQINMLNLLLNGAFGTLNKQQYEMLKLTYNSSKYMSDLVGNIMTRYKFEFCDLKLNKEKFNIIELINNICSENEYLAKEKSKNIIFNSNTCKCMVYADKLQISRVIFNLLSNAIQYSYNNTSIILNVVCNNEFIDFSVKNIANPLSDKEIKSIFNKFVCCKENKVSGTGLGLYVAKLIIDAHKGKIYANCNKEGLFCSGFILKLVSKNNLDEYEQLV